MATSAFEIKLTGCTGVNDLQQDIHLPDGFLFGGMTPLKDEDRGKRLYHENAGCALGWQISLSRQGLHIGTPVDFPSLGTAAHTDKGFEGKPFYAREC